ncbi:unnamed protein product [Linum tenue]|uniref:Uncharacterized protein n=1 Tax=Linum tenue TaxID=586396 RepID=A0AAV0IEL0_9ROSI|nr:unnamed protein product [Linum tenue]
MKATWAKRIIILICKLVRRVFYKISVPKKVTERILTHVVVLSVGWKCRNVLKATINVPNVGEVNFHCTHLDHLDEQWRMKQVATTDIVFMQYYEEMGKPTPKAEVMRFLKKENYTDAKDYAGECESVVMIAKGQNVQGTCKYGTRVDYIVASPNSPYKFVPGSYSVLSSKGTSDHHIVKVDVVKEHDGGGGGGGDNKSGGSRGYSGQQSVGRKNRGNRAQQTSLVK